MYFVYILRCKGKSLYTGIARDPKKRFREHEIKRRPRQKKVRLIEASEILQK